MQLLKRLYNIHVNKDQLITIGSYVLTGMSEKESCILSNVSYNIYLQQKENDQVTRDFIEKKLVEFKLNHITTIQKTKSEKNSMYLLEKLRPEEFGNKNRSGGEGQTINIISAIIKDIQNDNANQIVTFNRQKRHEDDKAIKEGAYILE